MPEPKHVPILKCPFCGGKKFDLGRDLHAGVEKVLYCHRSPDHGHRPEQDASLELKGAVCMTCGYVAMMVDVRALYGPILRAEAIARALQQDRKPNLAGLHPEGDERSEDALQSLVGGAGPPSPIHAESSDASQAWTAPPGGANEQDPADALRRLMEEGQSE